MVVNYIYAAPHIYNRALAESTTKLPTTGHSKSNDCDGDHYQLVYNIIGPGNSNKLLQGSFMIS